MLDAAFVILRALRGPKLFYPEDTKGMKLGAPLQVNANGQVQSRSRQSGV